MIKEAFVFGISRATLMNDRATPTYVKDWLTLADNKQHDPTDLANCAQVFADVLRAENKAAAQIGNKRPKAGATIYINPFSGLEKKSC